MYCPSCGVASTPGFSYCKRCGSSLTLTTSPTKATPSAINALMDSAFWVTVFGLAVIVGGVAAMKALEFREVFIIAYMILSTVAFLGIYGMHILQFVRLTREAKQAGSIVEAEGADTKELNPAQPKVLPDYIPSVTENTTRAFEPAPKRKAE